MLTPKREKFCQGIADGFSQADAYRRAFDCSNSKPPTVQSRACELMKIGEVKARVQELKSAVASKALWSREDSVLALREIAADPEARSNEKVAAIKELNAMHGFNAPQKVELSGAVTSVIRKVIDPNAN